MGQQNKSLRNTAIPFRAKWYDNSVPIGNTFTPGVYPVSGDLSQIGSLNGIGGLIRFTRPYYGNIISAHLTMVATTPAMSPTTLRFYKGTFDTDDVTAITSYAEADIAHYHKLLTGADSAYEYGVQDNVFFDAIDITPIIPKRGDDDFNDDGFILGVDLVCRDPADWYLYDFKVDCSVQLGALSVAA